MIAIAGSTRRVSGIGIVLRQPFPGFFALVTQVNINDEVLPAWRIADVGIGPAGPPGAYLLQVRCGVFPSLAALRFRDERNLALGSQRKDRHARSGIAIRCLCQWMGRRVRSCCHMQVPQKR